MPNMFDLIKDGDLAGVQRAVQDDPARLNATVMEGGRTPLMWACHDKTGCQPAIAKWLIERGAKLDLQNINGWTALMYACLFDQPDTAQLLIERGAKLDLQNNNGSTALMLACQFGNQPGTAQLLIERGAKLDLQDDSGWSALMRACRSDHPGTAQLLIERGAKLDLQNNDGKTALMLACDFGKQPGTAQLLIERGAKLDLQMNNAGRTALMYACIFEQPDTVQLLIQRGAKLDLQGHDGATALMFACLCDLSDTAQLLIEGGANLDLQENDGETALMLACQLGNDQLDTAQLLIERGAKLDLQNNDGWTALMLACQLGNDQLDTAQLLIERGAKLDLQNNDGWTALMLACQLGNQPDTAAGSLRCIKLCYAAGADLDLKNKNGRDAVAVAKYFNRSDVVAFLEFATASEVAGLLLGELRQPRSLVVAFYEEDLLTKRDCSVLQDLDLEGMGVTSSLKRRRILSEFNPNASQVPRASLPRRASRRVVRASRRLSGIYKYDAFLTHDWGEDGANHEDVSSVNAMLQRAGKVTWFDEERLSGDIVLQITQGIENSRKVVVFITERYMHKLRTGGNDFCKSEFMAAVRIHTPANMVAVVLESAMLNTSSWLGPLQFHLGGHLYIDFTTPAKREDNFSVLLERINA